MSWLSWLKGVFFIALITLTQGTLGLFLPRSLSPGIILMPPLLWITIYHKKSPAIWWWVLLLLINIEIFSALPFGAITISMLFALLAVRTINSHLLTSWSWVTLVIASLAANIIFYGGIWLANLIINKEFLMENVKFFSQVIGWNSLIDLLILVFLNWLHSRATLPYSRA